MKRLSFVISSTLAIGFVWLAAPLRAQFVYVVHLQDNNVSAYSIGANGALTPVPGSPFAAGNAPDAVAVDPTGKFAYVATEHHNVWAYSIGANGALTRVKGSPFAAGNGPVFVAVDPTGNFVYVANEGDTLTNSSVSAYSIGANGALTRSQVRPSKQMGTGRLGSLGSNGQVRLRGKHGLYPHRLQHLGLQHRGRRGPPTPVPGSPFAALSAPASVAVDPTGKFAYVANPFDASVSAYRIGVVGALHHVRGSPYYTPEPESVAVDPTGKFTYVTDISGNYVLAYSIGADGALTPVPGSPFGAGNYPNSVAVDPTGKFAYVVNGGDSTISAYSIGATGALTPVPGSPFTTEFGPGSVAISLVPFASSFAKLEIESELSTFHLLDSFTLGANSNGITPTTQKLTLNIGSTFSAMIPSGAFKKTATGTFIGKRTINGVTLNLTIVPLSANMFTFKVYGAGIDLGGLTEPVTVVLTIGIDSGTTKVHYGL